MRIFLTGGTGFIGKNFVKLAVNKGHYVTGVTRKKIKSYNKNISWLKGEINSNWNKELSKSDMLVHLAAAGIHKSKDNEDIYNTNVFSSLELLKKSIKYGCKKWLIISTSSEYGAKLNNRLIKFNVNTNRIPCNDYGLSKAIFTDQSIELAKKFKCKLRIMRIFPVYGKGENKKRLFPSLKKAARKGKDYFIKNPMEKRDFTSVKFVSEKLYDALDFNKKKFKTFQIWHISENKPQLVKNFAHLYWKKNNAKGKLLYRKNLKNKFNHLTDRSSLWK